MQGWNRRKPLDARSPVGGGPAGGGLYRSPACQAGRYSGGLLWNVVGLTLYLAYARRHSMLAGCKAAEEGRHNHNLDRKTLVDKRRSTLGDLPETLLGSSI